MKKLLLPIILLFTTVLLLSCNKNEDEDLTNGTHFNPPSWIQGTWGKKGTEYTNPVTIFRFTKNDFFSTMGFNTEMSYNGFVNNYNEMGSKVEVKENITSTMYEISIIVMNQSTTKYTFVKKGNNQIIWKNLSTDTVLDRLQ